MQIAVNDFQSYSFILESTSNIAELICRYACMEELLLRFPTAEDGSPPVAVQELKRALVQLYARVLAYLAKARAYFLQNTASKFVHPWLNFANSCQSESSRVSS